MSKGTVAENVLKKWDKAKSRKWAFLAITLFAVGTYLVYSVVSPALYPRDLPFVHLFNLTPENITHVFTCERGIRQSAVIIRGDTLICNLYVKNVPEYVSNYTVVYEQLTTSSGEFKVVSNSTFLLTNLTNRTYRADMLLTVPDSKVFGVSFHLEWEDNGEKKEIDSPYVMWIPTSSEEAISQSKTNALLAMIPAIIALFGIFQAIRALRDMWNT